MPKRGRNAAKKEKMENYVLSCCSTADLSKEHLESRNIRYTYFHFLLGGTEYVDDLGQTMPPEELYRRMLAGEGSKTSQVTVDEYTTYFDSLLKEGKDVLHICFSSGLSGSYNSALIARKAMAEKYPDRKLYVVDSLAASSGYGLIMETLADMRDEGKSIDELYDWIEKNKLRMHHWFFSTDLTFYIRGGRVSKVAGLIGQILNICPLLNMTNDGKLKPREKIRTKKKVMQRIVEKMTENASDRTSYSGKCFISHSACVEDARIVAANVESLFPKLNGKVQIFPIGATIGSHTGPGTIALFFWGDERED